MTLAEFKVKGGTVERTTEPRDPVKWEVCAPDGFRFEADLHVLCCFDMADVRERLADMSLEPCDADCACGTVTSPKLERS